jgi:octaprenyl-diphosphate synthase
MIIEKKTATLIAACCALGAKSVIEDELQVENMRNLVNSSEWLSNKDDLFDYTDEAIGKPTGMILKNKNDTASYLCFEYLYSKRKKLVNSIKITIKIKKRVKVIAFVKTITVCFTQEKMAEFQQSAFIVDNYPNLSLKSTILMVNYVIERKISNVFNANLPFSIALFPQILF